MFAEGCNLDAFLPSYQQTVGANYVRYAADAAAQYDVPLPLILAVIKTESNFYKNAISPAGARGLMQLMPTTCESLAKKLNIECDPFDAQTNVHLGTYYLSRLFKYWNGNWEMAIASYNAGAGGAKKQLEKHGKWVGETAKYVPAVFKRWAEMQQACGGGGFTPWEQDPVPKPWPKPKPKPQPAPAPTPAPAPPAQAGGGGGLVLGIAALALAWGLSR